MHISLKKLYLDSRGVWVFCGAWLAGIFFYFVIFEVFSIFYFLENNL